MTYLLTALTIASTVEAIVLWRLTRRIPAAERLDRRLGHFAHAMALLTDTTEAGLANVAIELEQAGRRRASRATTRQAASKRIVSAARRGRSLEEIAAEEAVSEGEIRLHLDMAESAGGTRDGAVRV